jgi:hypothetical protein
MRRVFLAAGILALACTALAQTTTPGDENWDNRFGALGADGTVLAIATNGSDIYFGGRFTTAGGIPANNIAKWDGTRWSALDIGTNGIVNAIAVSGSDVYVGGYFTTAGGIPANYIAKWDGRNWSTLGEGLAGVPPNVFVYALAVDETDVYVGGQFTTAGNVSASNIAKWDGENWSALGDGTDARVRALAVGGTDVYAGGNFRTAGGIAVSGIGKWDGESWSALGDFSGGGPDTVWEMAVSGTNLYVGGYFANTVAKWDGVAWSTLGSGLNGVVWALAASGDNVFAGGVFTKTGDGVTVNHVARWDGTHWTAMEHGLDNHVWALAVSDHSVYAGGDFVMEVASYRSVSHIARWNGSCWSSAGGGIDVDGKVLAIAATENEVYVGGKFRGADGIMANNIASYDGHKWSVLGTGVTGGEDLGFPVASIAVSDSEVYVSGWLTQAGQVPVKRVAKWDGSRWSDMGSGIQGLVFALAASETDVYIGGNFRIEGEFPANFVAKWDGSRWSAMGLGVDNYVGAIAVIGTDVYVGGSFTRAGGIEAPGIAKWDGNGWSTLGAISFRGLSGMVVSGGDILAGGTFSIAGGTEVNGIAKWHANSWTVLGEIPSGKILALAVSGSDVYIGGGFPSVNGVAANNIARWDGSRWSALGSGTDGTVSALAVRQGRVYAGGTFSKAGPYPSANFGIWSFATTVRISGTVTLNGNPLAGVVMSGLPGNVVTNAQGKYSALVDFGWSGTCAPTLAGHDFSPSSTTYSNVTSDRTTDYTATLVTLKISGTVIAGGFPIANVLMVGLPGNPATNAQGKYTGRVNFGWSGSVIPTLAGYAFSPVSRSYGNVVSDQVEVYLAVPTSLVAVLTADRVWGDVPFDVCCSASQIWDSNGNKFSYMWQLLKDGLPASPIECCVPSVVYTLDEAGIYVVLLTVSDNLGRSAHAYMAIYAGVNAPPVTKAGPDQSVHTGAFVILDGSGSSDPNGNYPLKYKWEILMKPEGSQAALSDPEAMKPSFTLDKEGTYLITLEVSDSEDVPGVSFDSMLVSTVNVPPVADAGPDQAITRIGTVVVLDGTQSYDLDGDAMSYSWTMTSKPAGSHADLISPSSPAPSFTADVKGTYTISLTVSDLWMASDPDEIVVTFSNVKPVADAGVNQSMIVGASVFLDGNGSSDANGDPLTYSWSMVGKPEGSEAILFGANSINSSFIPDMAGTYVVGLVVNDGTEDSESSNVTIVATVGEDTVAQQLIQTTAVINGLNPATLKNESMVNALTNKINEVLVMVGNGRYAEALDKLQNDILKKTDGCAKAGAPDKNDWVKDCASQLAVYAEVMKAIIFLKDLIGG